MAGGRAGAQGIQGQAAWRVPFVADLFFWKENLHCFLWKLWPPSNPKITTWWQPALTSSQDFIQSGIRGSKLSLDL